MGPVIRRFVSSRSQTGQSTCAAQGAEIHWLSAGRTAPDVVSGVPSIHMAWNGRLSLTVDRHALRLDDNVFLVLNGGHLLSTRGLRDPGACLLSVYFEPDLVTRTIGELPPANLAPLIPAMNGDALTFFEHLREHDHSIDCVMRYLAHHVIAGVDDAAWYQEQVGFLIRRLLVSESEITRAATEVSRNKPDRRREAFARLSRVTDRIHTDYEHELSMQELAQTAHWSVFHMMREFKALHGISPYEYLQRRRTQVAVHLLRTTELSVDAVAVRAGFMERSTMTRRLQRDHGAGARDLRRESRRASALPQGMPQTMARGAPTRMESATSISQVR